MFERTHFGQHRLSCPSASWCGKKKTIPIDLPDPGHAKQKAQSTLRTNSKHLLNPPYSKPSFRLCAPHRLSHLGGTRPRPIPKHPPDRSASILCHHHACQLPSRAQTQQSTSEQSKAAASSQSRSAPADLLNHLLHCRHGWWDLPRSSRRSTQG